MFPLAGHEGVAPASIKGPTCADVANVVTSHHFESSTDHVSMRAFPDRNDQNAAVNMAPNSLVSSTPTTPSSTVVGHEGKPSARSGEKPDELFECPDSECSKRFEKKSSVGRHYRKNHDSKPCLFSGCVFKYGGPYDYRYHLKLQHKLKNEVTETILGKTADSRCKATIIGRDLPKELLPLLLSLYTTD